MSVVNLNKARKARARSERKAKADANSVKYGRSKSEREHIAKTADLTRQRLDGHKRED